MIKMILKNKKAQIGTTITWVVAFTIIFFMLLILIGGSALLALKKSVPDVSANNPNSKSTDLTWKVVEPSGIDFGDEALQRELITFLNKPLENGERMGDLIGSFDSGIYSNPRLMGDSEIQGNEKMKLFYETAVKNFDEIYADCYVLCLEFRTQGGGDFKSITGNQIIVGKECAPKTSEIYGRLRGEYSCYVSNYNVGGMFNYARVDLHPDRNDGRVVAVKILKGGLKLAAYG